MRRRPPFCRLLLLLLLLPLGNALPWLPWSLSLSFCWPATPPLCLVRGGTVRLVDMGFVTDGLDEYEYEHGMGHNKLAAFDSAALAAVTNTDTDGSDELARQAAEWDGHHFLRAQHDASNRGWKNWILYRSLAINCRLHDCAEPSFFQSDRSTQPRHFDQNKSSTIA